jgi:hypothetical protein
VNRAWKVGASVASTTFAAVVEPSVVVPAGSGTTRRSDRSLLVRVGNFHEVA